MSAYLTVQEVAQLAKVAEKTVRRAIAAGRLPVHGRGVSGEPYLIAEDDFHAWFAVRPVEPKALALVCRPPVAYAHWDGLERDYAFVLLDDPCCYCGALCGHIDHVQALARGGGHGWENLTAACAPCNLAKGPKRLLTFLLQRVT